MNKRIFRDKNIERISSPEQLDDYVKVANPAVEMILISIIVLLIGICVWGKFGHLDTTLDVVAIAKDGVLTCYVTENNIKKIEKGMKISVDAQSTAISGISVEPMSINDTLDEYILHLGNLSVGEWVYLVTADTALRDGSYKAKIIIDSVEPMSFVLN